MTIPRDAISHGFRASLHNTRRYYAQGDGLPTLAEAGTRAVEAWFLGPRGENVDVLEQLIVEAIRDQAFWRRNFHPSDPSHITEAIKRDPEYLQALDKLQEKYFSLLAFLKKSVPFFSMRYQGHMNWDLTLPGMIGYFAAMLYNPNNVAFEGSTATTILEILVGDDLCRMLGYEIPAVEAVDAGRIRPWGHITCDGTVANIEAIWSARNLKFYPLALQEALKTDSGLAAAQNLEVPLPTGASKRLVDLNTWETLNLKADDVLAMPARLEREYELDRNAITRAVSPYTLQNMGLIEFSRRFLKTPPVFFVPGTKHYSFPKAAALLGLGASNMIDVPVDQDARQSVPALRCLLDACLATEQPVITVVAVIGSTEESAVDPLKEILELREEFRARGLEFTVHTDAAWGGYHASVVREDFALPDPNVAALAAAPLAVPLSPYVTEQFAVLGRADSITVDPHKSGYIPYPAGALCYRNSAMRDLVTFSAPVVFHGEAEPTVGIYGIEGSKPGAAAAAVYLSHSVIRPSKSGYGKIIGEALYSCRKLYARLLTLAAPTDPFIVVPVPRLPAEAEGQDPAEQMQFIHERIVGKTTSEIQNDPEAMALLRRIGPDENILAYAFNLRAADGSINPSLERANALNRALYDRLSINPGEDIYGYDLIVSTTDLDIAHYGEVFIEDYKRRLLGVPNVPGSTVTVLRSVVMDPWVTETTQGSFLDILVAEFRKAVMGALQDIEPIHTRGTRV
jgi:glutamate/tyrosine decarboxylase-like PLP-dependent enzyme